MNRATALPADRGAFVPHQPIASDSNCQVSYWRPRYRRVVHLQDSRSAAVSGARTSPAGGPCKWHVVEWMATASPIMVVRRTVDFQKVRWSRQQVPVVPIFRGDRYVAQPPRPHRCQPPRHAIRLRIPGHGPPSKFQVLTHREPGLSHRRTGDPVGQQSLGSCAGTRDRGPITGRPTATPARSTAPLEGARTVLPPPRSRSTSASRSLASANTWSARPEPSCLAAKGTSAAPTAVPQPLSSAPARTRCFPCLGHRVSKRATHPASRSSVAAHMRCRAPSNAPPLPGYRPPAARPSADARSYPEPVQRRLRQAFRRFGVGGQAALNRMCVGYA